MPDTKTFNTLQTLVLQTLADLGGESTTRQIALKANRNLNGVAQTLGRLLDHVTCTGGRDGDKKWKLNDATKFTPRSVQIQPIVDQDPVSPQLSEETPLNS